MTLNRRLFIQQVAFFSAGLAVGSKTFANQQSKFYKLKQKTGGEFRLIDPAGQPFFSLALNHIDPATLRYPENQHLWLNKYQNSMQKWLQEVRKDLLSWNFNSVGWVQEVVTRGVTNHRHSGNFTYENYQWLDLPYCHLLPFADFHQWEAETRYPDFYSEEFALWCDQVAREHCLRMKDDPNLIGYFYLDCPTWVHTTKESEFRGPLFDPDKLKTEKGRIELFDLATKYYQVTHDAIRRYDPHHLILGDRYNAQRPWAIEVMHAAKPFVDMMSYQHFGKPEEIREDLQMFTEKLEMPVLLADSGVPDYSTWELGYFKQDTERYAELLQQLKKVKNLIGVHFCGAYMRNKVRKYGLKDRQDAPDREAVIPIKVANQEFLQWFLNS